MLCEEEKEEEEEAGMTSLKFQQDLPHGIQYSPYAITRRWLRQRMFNGIPACYITERTDCATKTHRA